MIRRFRALGRRLVRPSARQWRREAWVGLHGAVFADGEADDGHTVVADGGDCDDGDDCS